MLTNQLTFVDEVSNKSKNEHIQKFIDDLDAITSKINQNKLKSYNLEQLDSSQEEFQMEDILSYSSQTQVIESSRNQTHLLKTESNYQDLHQQAINKNHHRHLFDSEDINNEVHSCSTQIDHIPFNSQSSVKGGSRVSSIFGNLLSPASNTIMAGLNNKTCSQYFKPNQMLTPEKRIRTISFNNTKNQISSPLIQPQIKVNQTPEQKKLFANFLEIVNIKSQKKNNHHFFSSQSDNIFQEENRQILPPSCIFSGENIEINQQRNNQGSSTTKNLDGISDVDSSLQRSIFSSQFSHSDIQTNQNQGITRCQQNGIAVANNTFQQIPTLESLNKSLLTQQRPYCQPISNQNIAENTSVKKALFTNLQDSLSNSSEYQILQESEELPNFSQGSLESQNDDNTNQWRYEPIHYIYRKESENKQPKLEDFNNTNQFSKNNQICGDSSIKQHSSQFTLSNINSHKTTQPEMKYNQNLYHYQQKIPQQIYINQFNKEDNQVLLDQQLKHSQILNDEQDDQKLSQNISVLILNKKQFPIVNDSHQRQ